MPQEFLKHAIPDCLVRGTELFPLDRQKEKKVTVNKTIALWSECSVLNHNYIGHVTDLHLIVHVTQ